MKRRMALMAAPIAAIIMGVHGLNAGRDCEGNACSVVTMRYDGVRYHFTNNSDRAVTVEVRNWAAGNSIALAASETKAAFLTAFFLPYRANFQ